MERQFPAKVANLVAGVTSTLTWGAVDISQRFPESVIKAPNIAIRFSCSTTAGNAVNCGVRYSTLTKDYRVSERETLFQIAANGSAEVTPASKPALGRLNTGITSISVDVMSLASGTATIVLIVDDDAPPLSSDPGQLVGLDARLALDYQQVNIVGGASAGPGTISGPIYTVPANNRFFIDVLSIEVDPTPSYPGTFKVSAIITINGTGALFNVYSKCDEFYVWLMPPIPTPLQAGDVVSLTIINADSTNHTYQFNLIGRQLF